MPELLLIDGRIGASKLVRTAIVRGDDAWLWIDAGICGTPTDAILPELRRRGLEPPARNVLAITHGDVDHFGGTAELRTAVPGIVVIAHDADAEIMSDLDRLVASRYDRFGSAGIELPPARATQLRARAGAAVRADVRLTGPASVSVDGTLWQLLPLPGHSAGHLAVLSPDGRTAFAGDAVMAWGVRDGDGNLMPPHYTDVAAYLGTIQRLTELRLQTLHLSHEQALEGAQITEFLDATREAVRAVGDAVDRARSAIPAEDGHRLRHICDAVHAELGRWPDAPASSLADAVAAHLDAAGERSLA